MKKFSTFKILFHYLKDEKLKMFIYILLVLFTYIPSLVTAYFWGIALEPLSPVLLLKLNIFFLVKFFFI